MAARWIGALVFCAASLCCFAQSPDRPVFKSGTNLVQATAVVRDSQGKAVGGLTADDFQLFDNGALQTISRFAVERRENSAIHFERGGGATTGTRSPAVLPNRFVAFVVDDQNLVPENFGQAPLAAIRHIDELGPGDRAAVVATSGHMVLEFTADRGKLRNALSGMGSLDRRETFDVSKLNPEIRCRITYLKADRILEGDPGSMHDCVPVPGQQTTIRTVRRNMPGPPVPQQGGEGHRIFLEDQVRAWAGSIVQAGDRDVKSYFAGLARLIVTMSKMPGERSIIVLSPGMYIAPRFRNLQDEVIAAAVRARVVISGVDPRGVYIPNDPADPSTWVDTWGLAETSERYGFMENVTSGTGGTFIRGNNDIAGAVRRLDSAPEFVYILGFSPTLQKLDGKYHPLRIALRRSRGLTIDARRGYYAVENEGDDTDQAEREIGDAFYSGRQLHEIPVKLQMRSSHKPDAAIILTAVAHIDLSGVAFRKIEGSNRSELTMVIGVFDQDGNAVKDFWKDVSLHPRDEELDSLRAAGLDIDTNFDVAPGHYVVRVAVRDSAERAMGTASAGVEIRP
jgi:VWFA-related protein